MNRASTEFYGKSFDEIMNTIEKAQGEAQKAQSEKLEAQSEKLEAQKVIVRSIINFHDRMSLNAEQIANMLDLEVSFVSEVLEKYENKQK
jgi:NADH:ubiquinone oxidoreductase subunit E